MQHHSDCAMTLGKLDRESDTFGQTSRATSSQLKLNGAASLQPNINCRIMPHLFSRAMTLCK